MNRHKLPLGGVRTGFRICLTLLFAIGILCFTAACRGEGNEMTLLSETQTSPTQDAVAGITEPGIADTAGDVTADTVQTSLGHTSMPSITDGMPAVHETEDSFSETDELQEPVTLPAVETDEGQVTEPATQVVIEIGTGHPRPMETEPSVTEPETEIDFEAIQQESLPRIDITTEGGVAIDSKDYYVRSTISMSGCEEQYLFSDNPAGIRVRGNSTATAPKKPYRIKFDTKQSMLGLNGGKKFKSWCLMADYFDSSMLRTWATFKFAEVLLEGKYYSSDCTPVEVYINGEYMGVYLLCEQSQIDGNRVDIYEREDGDTSVEIGYLMIGQGGRNDEPESLVVYPEITVYDRNGDSMYFGGMNFALSGSDYTDEQKEYVSRYTSAVFKVVAAALYEEKYYHLDRNGNMTVKTDFKGTTTEEKQIETIDAVFNIEAAIRMCALDEIVKNLDAMTFNMYVDLSPEGDGRLTLAAPWDFDFSMANTHYSTTHSYNGFYATNLSYSEGMRTNLWYVMFGSIPWFEDMISEVWKAHYDELCDLAEEVLVMSYRYADAYDRDYERWGMPANRSLIHHHCQADLATYTCHLDVGIFLNDWLEKRLRWLDKHWGDGVYEPVTQSPLLEVDLTNPDHAVYLKDFKRCRGEITQNGLRVTLIEARDPYFTLDFSWLEETFEADDYPYLEITVVVPSSNQYDEYSSEFFLCSGSTTQATGGISVVLERLPADTQVHTYRINLSESGHWSGQIHSIRIDYFNACEPGDVIYIQSVGLKTS